jgi:quercetin dioxygenase-like cupin family protein
VLGYRAGWQLVCLSAVFREPRDFRLRFEADHFVAVDQERTHEEVVVRVHRGRRALVYGSMSLSSLVTPTAGGIASRILAKTSGGSLTLFAFDPGQGLTEHTSPFEALVIVLEGSCTLTIGGTSVRATPGTVVRMPADVPHALDAVETTRLLLVMLREPQRE